MNYKKENLLKTDGCECVGNLRYVEHLKDGKHLNITTILKILIYKFVSCKS